MWSKSIKRSSISNHQKKFNNLNSLGNNFKRFSFYKGDLIPQESHNLWLIESGVVKTFALDIDGNVATLGYWGAKDVVGLPLSKAENYKATCIENSEALFIPWKSCNSLYQEISSCAQQTEQLLRIIRTEKMHFRLSKLLIWFAQKFGKKVINGVLIDIRITHQDLADIMGSTRVTVTRLLNKLEQERMIIRPCRFTIVIKDIQSLKANSNFF